MVEEGLGLDPWSAPFLSSHELPGKGVRLAVPGTRVIRQGEVKLNDEQGSTSLMRVETFNRTDAL